MMVAADVSANGEIQAHDAATILKYDVQDPQALNSLAGTWDFYCPARCYIPDTLIVGADFTAILRGDVTGNWNHEGRGGGPGVRTPIVIRLEAQHEANRVHLYLATTEFDELRSGHAELIYMTEHYGVAEVALIGPASDFMLAVNDSPGHLRLACAGAVAVPAGRYLRITLDRTPGHPFSFDDFTWERLEINDSLRPVVLLPDLTDVVEAAWDGRTPVFDLIPSTFTDQMAFRFAVLHPGVVRLTILSIEGRLVHTVVNGFRKAGIHRATWDGRTRSGTRAAGGVYFCRLEQSGRRELRRLVCVR